MSWIRGESGGEGREDDSTSQESGEGDVGVAVAEGKPKEAQPSKFAVVLHNDDYTTMEFVIDVLKRYFHKSEEEAAQIMLSVHNQGKGIAGTYSYEIAETKAQQVIDYARAKKFPLMCTVEPHA